MQPLDLRTAPPRLPRETTRDIIFLPRSIDKARASLPGGDRGLYDLTGITERLVEAFGKTLDGLVVAVAAATDDDDVADWLLLDAPPNAAATWQAWILARTPKGGGREQALELYPWVADHPDMTLTLDILVEDDRRTFSAPG